MSKWKQKHKGHSKKSSRKQKLKASQVIRQANNVTWSVCYAALGGAVLIEIIKNIVDPRLQLNALMGAGFILITLSFTKYLQSKR